MRYNLILNVLGLIAKYTAVLFILAFLCSVSICNEIECPETMDVSNRCVTCSEDERSVCGELFFTPKVV